MIPQTPSQSLARILIVDNHPLVREGLASRIELQADMKVCGEAESLETALSQIKTTRPDLLIIDIELADSNGFELVKEIVNHFPEIKMLVVSASDASFYAERAFRVGAHGYVNKRELQGSIIDALRKVLAGESYFGSQQIEKSTNSVNGGETNTPR